MNALPATPAGDDEKSLLVRLEHLLDREAALRDADGLAAVADERSQLVERVAAAARRRRTAPAAADEADLVALYRRLRQRHDVRAQVLRRHADQNTRALGVLAQASGQPGLYKADGSVRMQFGGR